jgi:hypothetical protein
MKNWHMIAAFVFMTGNAWGSPYFRPLNLSHPQLVAWAILDPRDLGNSEAASLLPVFTHSPKDGWQRP